MADDGSPVTPITVSVRIPKPPLPSERVGLAEPGNEQQVVQLRQQMPGFSTPCLVNGLYSSLSAGGLGFFFGAIPSMLRNRNIGLWRMWCGDGWRSAMGLSVVSGMYTWVHCLMQRIRMTEDGWNRGVAGCATGLVIGFQSGPFGAAQSCAGLGLLSYIVDLGGVAEPAPAHAAAMHLTPLQGSCCTTTQWQTQKRKDAQGMQSRTAGKCSGCIGCNGISQLLQRGNIPQQSLTGSQGMLLAEEDDSGFMHWGCDEQGGSRSNIEGLVQGREGPGSLLESQSQSQWEDHSGHPAKALSARHGQTSNCRGKRCTSQSQCNDRSNTSSSTSSSTCIGEMQMSKAELAAASYDSSGCTLGSPMGGGVNHTRIGGRRAWGTVSPGMFPAHPPVSFHLPPVMWLGALLQPEYMGVGVYGC